MKKFIITTVLSLLAFPLLANTSAPHAMHEVREIKVLSPQQISAYLNGKGLGFGKAAELNQFPGPSHVLELATELNLSKEQVSQTQKIFERMKAQASKLGRLYVEKEQELDLHFSVSTIDSVSLKTRITDIGKLQASIRYVHLNAHLEQKAILTKHQIQRYDQLRGYSQLNSSIHSPSH
ncbi:MAG: hypothetical protein V5789_03800 [Colwellia sp.]